MLKQLCSLTLISCLSSLLFCHANTKPLELTDANASAILAQEKKPVIIDFYGTWCPPCKRMAPLFEKFAKADGNIYLFAKADCRKAPELTKKYEVDLLPTFAVIKDTKLLGKVTGAHSLDALKKQIAEIINSAKSTHKK